MIPPFTITPLILRRVGQIERLIGRIEGLDQPKPQPHLRKTNRVRTVHGSLAIEGNTLDRAGQEFSKQKFSRPNGPTKRARQQSEAPPWVPRPQMTVPPRSAKFASVIDSNLDEWNNGIFHAVFRKTWILLH